MTKLNTQKQQILFKVLNIKLIQT